MRYVLIACLLVARAASAQPPGETSPPPQDEKSVFTAYLVTIAATSGPIAVASIVAGDENEGTTANVAGIVATTAMMLGPSAGHWYAGDAWTTGLTLRLGAAGLVGAMVLRDQQEPLELPTVVIGLTAAGGLWATGALWDFFTLPRAVRRYNREHAIVIAPTTNGVAIAGRF